MNTQTRNPRAVEGFAPGGERLRRAAVKPLRGLAAALVFFLVCAGALGQDPVHPLKPPDRSSPRATLKTFLESGDAVGEFLAREYVPSPTRAKFRRLAELVAPVVQCLDLSKLRPAARPKEGRAAAVALYEILGRIPLPPIDQIPDAGQVEVLAGTGSTRWVIPNTAIALVRVKSGPRSGEFLFSTDTVARAGEFYARVRGLPYTRPVAIENLHELVTTDGGWMIPHAWIQAMPAALRTPLADQPGWKWIGLALILGALALFLSQTYRLSQLGRQHRFLQALAQFALRVSVLAVTPAAAYLALVQLNLTSNVGGAVELATAAIMFLAGAWMSWRFAPVVAEAIIASPNIAPESIDAHLIRVSARLLGIMGSATLLALGADRLGAPLYGIVAGLGVGGLAIALAAQPTIENLIGGLNLFADRPVRVGDFCKYGEELGTVESIGIRSARIRGIDRTLTTIPNAALAKMPIVNLTRRDQMLIRTVIGLRYETTPEQLRFILVKLREMLLGHPRINPDPARARFVGFGASSLDIEVYAYVMTRDWGEFLGIREDIFLRVMDIIEQGGASIAFPSQTLYLGRDHGAEDGKVGAAEATVRAWRDEGSLPLPNFSAEQAAKIRGSITYPPPGSTEAPRPKPSPDGASSP
jgi:MscS family membrane protein